MRNDKFRTEITEKVIELMKSHGADWVKPWASQAEWPTNSVTKAKYHGINVMLLMMAEQGSSEWASYKQWASKGAQVKKGEHGTHIVFFKTLTKERDDGGKDVIPMMRNYTVFNASQVEGYEPPHLEGEGRTFTDEDIRTFIGNTKAEVKTGDKAFYRPSTDEIYMPRMEAFNATDTSSAEECYWTTLFHELTHWTGNKTRLARESSYAAEELVAELGSVFLALEFGVSPEPRADHAKYLNSWIKEMGENDRCIFRAAAAAGKAVEFMESLQLEEVA